MILILKHGGISACAEVGLSAADLSNAFSKRFYAAAVSAYNAGEAVGLTTIQPRMMADGGLTQQEERGLLVLTKTETELDAYEVASRIKTRAESLRLARSVRGELEKLEAGGDMIGFAERIRDEIDRRVAGGSEIHGVSLSQALADAERYYALGTISTGFPRLDATFAGGLRGGEPIVIGGRPGAGKSLFTMHILTAAAKADHKVAMLSLEMTPASISQRMLARESGVPLSALRRGDGAAMRMPSVKAAKERLMQLERRLKIVNPGLQYDDIARSIRGLAAAGYKMVAIDYIQKIITKTRDKRSDELSAITGGLSNLAIMTGMPIIEVAQIRRAYQGAADKPPTMNDLKDSGSIEQDARIIILLWEERRQQGGDCTLTASIAKQNDGDAGVTIHYDWHKQTLDLVERPMGRVYEDNGYGRNDWSDINLR